MVGSIVGRKYFDIRFQFIQYDWFKSYDVVGIDLCKNSINVYVIVVGWDIDLYDMFYYVFFEKDFFE